MINIYIGNLPYSISDEELGDLFSPFGEISSSKVVMDRESGRSKGFGFVEMLDKADADEAIKALDGSSVSGRNIRVNEARPREPRPRR